MGFKLDIESVKKSYENFKSEINKHIWVLWEKSYFVAENAF